MKTLIVLSGDTVVYTKTYNSEEEFDGAVYYWKNCTDSEGRRKYTLAVVI